MTLPVQAVRSVFNGAGTIVNLPIGFYYRDPTHVMVIEIDEDGVATTLVNGTDYSISADGPTSETPYYTSAYVVPSSAIAIGVKWAILRSQPIEQDTNLVVSGTLDSQAVMRAWDKLCEINQELADLLARAILASPGSDPEASLVLPGELAGKAIVGDDDGNLATAKVLRYSDADEVWDGESKVFSNALPGVLPTDLATVSQLGSGGGGGGGGSGDVVGPGSSTANHVALFSDTTGALLKDGGALAAVATSGSASDLSTGTLPAARLPATTVTAGAYSAANITVGADGRITAASNGSAGAGITVGSSGISGGTNGYVLYDNSGTLGEMALAASATTDTTNASNISSGTMAVARLPVGSSSAKGVLQVDGTTITATSGVISSVATGGLSFTAVTTNTALSAGTQYRITSATQVTITLPASPTSGQTIRIQDGGTITGGVTHVLARNGNTLQGLAQDMTLDVINCDFMVWWNGSDWRVAAWPLGAAVSSYSLPVATNSVLGGVKQGTGITIAGDGTASLTTDTTNASNISSGTLGAARGGTGVNSAAAANGQLLIGTGSGLALANLTAGSNVTITNSSGGITIAASVTGSTGAYVNILDYGGSGNNSTNNVSAIASAIAALPATGGVVLFPPGIYRVNSTVTITGNNIVLAGVGNDGTSIIRATFSTGDIIAFGSGGANNPQNCGIENLYIDSTVSRSSGASLLLTNTHTFRAKRVKIGTNSYEGIQIEGGSNQYNTYIDDCGVYAGHYGLLVGSTGATQPANVWVRNCNFNNCSEGVHLQDISGIMFETCEFLSNGYGFVVYPSSGRTVRALYLARCFVDTSTTLNVLISAASGGTVVEINLTDCWISNAGAGATSAGGLKIDGPTANDVRSIKISDSRILANGGRGIELGLCKDVDIVDCQIGNNSQSSNNTYSGIAIAAGTSKFAIQGCRIGHQGVYGTASKQKYGIEISTGAGDQFIVMGNDLTGNVTAAISNGASGTNKVLTNNLT